MLVSFFTRSSSFISCSVQHFLYVEAAPTFTPTQQSGPAKARQRPSRLLNITATTKTSSGSVCPLSRSIVHALYSLDDSPPTSCLQLDVRCCVVGLRVRVRRRVLGSVRPRECVLSVSSVEQRFSRRVSRRRAGASRKFITCTREYN